MIPADVMAQLATLGLSQEQARSVAGMLATVEAATKEECATAIEARRANDRERKARQRHGTSRDVTGQDVTSGDKKEIPPTPPKEKTKTKPNGLGVSVARASDLADFRAELLDLDADRLDAIEKHRRSKRGQLTGHSARLFRRDAEACGLSLADAVDTCISRNWITVKPEYLAGRQPRANAPPDQPRNAGELALMRLNGTAHESPRTDTGRLDARDGQRQAEGPGISRRFAFSGNDFGRT